MKKIEGIATVGQEEYAKGVKCPETHGGNRRLAHSQRGWWQCAGCGKIFSTDWVADEQEE